MEQKIKQLKQLRAEVKFWEEQKYYDNQAKQEAMMNARKHDSKKTEKVIAGFRQANAELSTFELFNYDVVEALDEMVAAEAKAKTEAAIKSAWNN